MAAYLLVFVRMENPAERTHLIEYGFEGDRGGVGIGPGEGKG